MLATFHRERVGSALSQYIVNLWLFQREVLQLLTQPSAYFSLLDGFTIVIVTTICWFRDAAFQQSKYPGFVHSGSNRLLNIMGSV